MTDRSDPWARVGHGERPSQRSKDIPSPEEVADDAAYLVEPSPD